MRAGGSPGPDQQSSPIHRDPTCGRRRRARLSCRGVHRGDLGIVFLHRRAERGWNRPMGRCQRQHPGIPISELSYTLQSSDQRHRGRSPSSSWSHSLVAGIDYWIVVTGYCGTGNGPGTGSVAGCTGPSTLEEGPFAASLTGPGTITALGEEGDNVPEPSSFALLLGPAVLLSVLGRRRQPFLTRDTVPQAMKPA